MSKHKPKRDLLADTENYIAFLEKRLASNNYKANVSPEEYKAEKAKLDKARFRLRILKTQPG